MRQWMGAAMALGLLAGSGTYAQAEGEPAAAASGSASADASGSGAGSSAAATGDAEVLASPQNGARYRTCLGEAGADRDKRKACRATRLSARAARERRIKTLRRAWVEARKAVKPALASCRKLKDKAGAKEIGAWAKKGDGWQKSLVQWRKNGGTVVWQVPAAFEPCKVQEKPAKKEKKKAKKGVKAKTP